MNRSPLVHRFLLAAVVVGFCLLQAYRAAAAFGGSDPAFGVNGFQMDPGLDFRPSSFARQIDGKILVTGKRYDVDLGNAEETL